MNKTAVKFGLMTITVGLVATLAAFWVAAIYREHDSRAALLPDQVITLFSDPKPLEPFTLTDHRNRVFDLASLKGKWTFLFFGFTHCPDICPTTMAVLARAREDIARQTSADDVQFVFVSVDPNRDTANKLRQYVGYFDSSFLGASGDNSQIADLAGQLGAAYRVAAATPIMENYPVFHSTAIFLLDPRARYHAVFTPPHDAESISRRFKVVRTLETGNAT